MIKIFLFLSVVIYSFVGSVPTLSRHNIDVEPNRDKSLDKWSQHLQDFVEVVDFSAVFSVVLKHIEDDEVKAFMAFVTSTEFENLVFDFESLDEFHEIVSHLTEKGYDVVPLINAINPFLNIPPYVRPKRTLRKSGGLADFITDLVKVLPMEKWMNLFEKKLQNDPEFRGFFETLSSPDFIAITKRLEANPKFQEIKKVFQSKGLDSKLFCELVANLFGISGTNCN